MNESSETTFPNLPFNKNSKEFILGRHFVRKHKCETLQAWSKSKTGMSAAKAERQSTETLSFRCWCEGCHLMRGRIDVQKM